MQVGNERGRLHPALDSSLFIGFPCGSFGVACILIDTALWKSPMAVPSAHQKEFQFTASHPVTHGGNMNSLGMGPRAINWTPPE